MTDTLLPPTELDEFHALRADVYRLLARLLREAPDHVLLDWLAGLEVEDDDSPLATHWRELIASARDAAVEELTRAHFRHLVGVIQGDVTPYASWYRNGELMDTALVTLRRDLKALGVERNERTRDPEDHLAALCEVMALLIEARSPAEARFFMTHLAPWAGHCLADLAAVASPFYSRLGRLGRAFTDTEEALLASEAAQDPVRLVEP
ncbi:TorD/DmsD family molecular chaperone [Halomonas heilongjiangensis]|uniref:Molecular chaperone TorD n=1 Tax=Halomonas heilongjiangensis TaxID=1387883 RepID=A0A2N7TR90_9GAMM|nr:molecular chaperone TorD family protein [Halomonas heilongjiangensis]PMR70628.1 molecular chaperone TorD [Halomonas heilongjiangensis]PXX88816.1 molecular chaperone TorD [Halomonas heilongjiangensis]